MACPTCGAETPTGKKFCGRCGADLMGPATASASVSSVAKNCPRCGSQVPLTKKFCGACGSPISHDEVPAPSGQTVTADAPAAWTPRVGSGSGSSEWRAETRNSGIDLPRLKRKILPGKVMASAAAGFATLLAVAAWSTWGVELDIISDPPGAEVAVDGKVAGSTDNQGGGLSLLHLPRGRHLVKVTHPGFEVWSQPVSTGWFALSRQLNVRLAVPSFPLTVLTSPGGARVQVDGRDVGPSDQSGSLVVGNIPRGQHTLTVTLQGYPPWSNVLRIQSPSTVRVDLAAAAVAFQQEITSRLSRAQAFYEQGQHQAAIAECEAVLRLDPSSQQAANLKAAAEKAVGLQLAATARQEIASRLGRAQALYQQREYREAIAECDAVLRSDPSNQQAARLKSQVQETVKILGLR